MPLLLAPPPAVVRLRGIHVDFSGRAALSDVDLDIEPGMVTVIAGPNGAGKSTLLEVIAGTRRPTSGARAAVGAVAFVPQRTAVSDRLPMTVTDVVTVGVWGRVGSLRRVHGTARVAVDDALQQLQITDLAALSFATLSGGQRQRTLLAQGIARGAELLLLDEPTTGLDSESAERIRTVMRLEADHGTAVVCVSHDAVVIADADRLIRVVDGRVASGVSPDDHVA